MNVRQYASAQWLNPNAQKLKHRSSAGEAIENINDPTVVKQKVKLGERVGPDPDYEVGIVKNDTDLFSNTTISTDNQRVEIKYNEVKCVCCSTRLLTSKTTIAVECPNCLFVSPATSVASTLFVQQAIGSATEAVKGGVTDAAFSINIPT
jgi:Zn finger protein HypA/HybF involved in hydrogenase expression